MTLLTASRPHVLCPTPTKHKRYFLYFFTITAEKIGPHFFQETPRQTLIAWAEERTVENTIFLTKLMIFKSYLSNTVSLLQRSNAIDLKISFDSNKGYSLIALPTSTYRILKVIT